MRTTVLGLLVLGACRAAESGDGLDAGGQTAPDAPPPGDGAAQIDAVLVDAALIDAALIDAALVDAALIDAALIDAAPPDAPPSPVTPWAPPQALPPGMCAPALGDTWTGTVGDDFEGCSSCSIGHSATVSWQRVSTTGCVDRYVPSGSVRRYESYECLQGAGTIAATDGEMVIDRSTVPPTYTMQGTTQWTAMWGCDDPHPGPVTVTWARFRGEVAGDAFGGGGDWDSSEVWWRFTRADATPPTPAPCVEPAVDVWVGNASQARLSAQVTWIRASTTGCVDHFVPMGVVTHTSGATPGCTHQVTEPDQGPIGPNDGWLTINRSQWPVRFTMGGDTRWTGETRCTRADGTVVVSPHAGGEWAERHAATYSGDRFAGGVINPGYERAWAASKVP